MIEFAVRQPDERRFVDAPRHHEVLSEGGGHVCGSSHDVSSNVSTDNLCAMAETVGAFTRQPE